MTTTVLQPYSVDFARPLGGLELFLADGPTPAGALRDGRPESK
jgi:hypothetical protein